MLIYAIRATCGVDAFNPTAHLAWIKIYSRMLKTMVPVAVAHELKDGSSFQSKRFLTNSLGNSQLEEELAGLTKKTSTREGGQTTSLSLSY